MKKIALIIITALALNLMIFAIPMVGHAGDIKSDKMTFNVTNNLKLGDTTYDAEGDGTADDSYSNQEMVYFKTNGEGNTKSPIVNLIKRVIEYASYIIGSIAVILVMVAGFMFMVSQGNQQKIDEAKEIFRFAAIGLVIVFMSYIITIFVQSIFISAK